MGSASPERIPAASSVLDGIRLPNKAYQGPTAPNTPYWATPDWALLGSSGLYGLDCHTEAHIEVPFRAYLAYEGACSGPIGGWWGLYC